MAAIGQVKIDMSDLVSALVKFQEWQAEYADIRLHQNHNDAADQLMEALGIPNDHVSVLIGGSNAPILKRAADCINSLRNANPLYLSQESVEAYIQDEITWSEGTPDIHKTLVAGNIRAFAQYLRAMIGD